MVTNDELLLSSMVTLWKAVYGRDSLPDALAELTHYEEEPQGETETDESYKARQQRVKERKERLGTAKAAKEAPQEGTKEGAKK